MSQSIYGFYDTLTSIYPKNRLQINQMSEQLIHQNYSFLSHYKRLHKLEFNEYKQQEGGKLYEINGLVFNINKLDENDRVTYSIYNDNNDNDPECMVLFIPKKENYVYIEGISALDKCVVNGILKTNIGTTLLQITLKFIKKSLKEKYNLKYIVLRDTSLYKCPITKKIIEFDSIYMLSRGTTWYGKYGFIPYDFDNKEVDKFNYKKYKKNSKLVNTIKVKDTNIKKYLEKTNLLKQNVINKIIDKYNDKTIKDFFYDLTKKYDETCDIIGSIYKDVMTDIGMSDLHGKSYFLEL